MVPSVKQHVQECIEKYESSGGCQIFIASAVLTNNVSDPSAFTLPGVIIWDPLNRLVCFSSGIQCPHCRLPLKARYWKDGRNDKHDTPRELWDIDGKVLLVSRVYVCSSDHRIIAHDPLILESIPVPGTIPLLLSHKVGVTLRLNEVIISHVIAGFTFSQIEQLIVQLHWNRHSKLASCYWEEIQKGQVNNTVKSANVSSYQEFNVSNFPSRRLVNLCFVGDYANNEQLYATRMSLHSAKQLSCDHTFKVAANIGIWIGTRWVQQYDTLFAVLNEQGLVVAWQLAKGCSFSKVKHTLLNLKKRLEKGNEKVESFCIDNCCQWRNLIKEIFGNHTEVKLDLFHAVQRISSQIPKHHPFRKQCVAALRLVFRHHDDLEKDRKRETPCSSEIM